MKKFLITVGLIVVLLIVAVLLLPFLVDLNTYKDQYQPMIEEALNRKITLNDLRLTILPRIGVRIAGFTVMDDPTFSRTPFASLDSLDIGVKLLPLLTGHVEVEEITLKEPVVSVIKNQHGVLNVSTIGKQGPPPSPESRQEAPPAPTAEGGPLRALAMLAVDRVALEHGRIIYRDQSTPKPGEYTVQDLNVLLQSVRLGHMPRLHVDAVVQPYNIPLTIEGVVGPLVETLDLKTIDLAIALGKTTATITGSAVGGHAALTVASPIINTAHLPVALPLAKPVEIRDLHVEAEADYPAKPNTPPLDAATVKVLRFAVVLGNSIINVNGNILEGEARLMATSTTINTVDLPMILPLRKPVEVTDVKLSAGMKGQHAKVDNLSLNVFGGQLLSQAGLTLGSSSPLFDGKVNLQGVQLGPVVEALMETLTVSGTANAQMALQGRGFSKMELMSGLEGNGSFTVKDGTIEGVNLVQEAVRLLNVAGITLDATKATVFSTIEGRFGIKHGTINVERFLMDSHDFQATGGGAIELDQTLNLKTKLSLSEALSKQIVTATPALRMTMTGNRMTVPMLITGTAKAPVYALDAKAFAGKIQEQVREQVRGVADDLLKGKKPDLEKGKEALKNLFGR
ncbi:MAG: AsmA family protein [Nitrospirales bacterium]|nr:AsmA family protein [Nitrospirales bacterium]